MNYRVLDISILIKTFMRPQCLDNLLLSIKNYQIEYNIYFKNIVIIDDSDDKHIELNKNIVKNYENCLNINYKEYAFDSLGISKGRNVGINEIHTKYFILCDDDFILDPKCSLENNLKLAVEKNLDILGGFYRNIAAADDEFGSDYNWLGFINENAGFDLCLIFSDFFPEFCFCDIVENFYIAKTDCFQKIKYPEYMPMLEHNVFFLMAKQQGLKVGFTNNLWTKHFHINNNSGNYQAFRDRNVVNPINKEVIGYHFYGDAINRFYDYLHVSTDELFIKTKKKQKFYKKFLNLFKKHK